MRLRREIVIGAVDIGGTKIAVGMVDDSGKVLSRLESPTGAPDGYANGLARIIDMLRRTSRDVEVEIAIDLRHRGHRHWWRNYFGRTALSRRGYGAPRNQPPCD